MASVTYLGRHEPAGLNYLIEESLLPRDPSADLYAWQLYDNTAEDDGGDDELLTTSNCVIWASNGIIQRVFRFRDDSQKVLHAVLTVFDSDSSLLNWEDALNPRTSEISGNEGISNTGSAWVDELRSVSGNSAVADKCHRSASERALVIILEHEAQIFFSQGAHHIINLPFEVERIFPIPKGVVIQRKSADTTSSMPSPTTIRAPHNTFSLSQDPPWPRREMQNVSNSSNYEPHKPSNAALRLSDFGNILSPLAEDSLPRLFVLLDPLSPIKPVLTSVPSSKSQSHSTGQSIEDEYTDEIDGDEELLYVSANDEMSSFSHEGSKPLVLALTVNRMKGTLAIWKTVYMSEKPGKKERPSIYLNPALPKSHRRSSHGTRTSTGVQTPLLRNPSGPRDRTFNPQQSFVASQDPGGPESDMLSLGLRKTEQLNGADSSSGNIASSQRSIANRRTSSIVARAELPAPDQPLFSDLSRISSTLRGSLGGNIRKSIHVSGVSERASFGRTRVSGRFSTSASIGRLSDVEEQSFQDYSSDELKSEFAHRPLADEIYTDQTHGSDDEKVNFKLVWMAPVHDLGLSKIFDCSKSLNEHKIQVVTSLNLGIKRERYPWLTSFFISDKSNQSMVQICIRIKQEEIKPAVRKQDTSSEDTLQSMWVPSRHAQLRLHTRVLDYLKIQDGSICRLLMLYSRPTGPELSIMADIGIDDTGDAKKSVLDSETGLEFGFVYLDGKKWMGGGTALINHTSGLSMSASSGKFDIIVEQKHHQVQIQLRPTNAYVGRVLDATSFVVSGAMTLKSSFLCVWWQFCQKFKQCSAHTERYALAAAIFCFLLQNEDLPMQKESRVSPNQLDTLLSGETPNDINTLFTKLLPESKIWRMAYNKALNRPKSSTFVHDEKDNFVLLAIQLATEHILRIRGTQNQEVEKMTNSVRHIAPRLLVVLHLMREEEKLDIASPEVSDSSSSSIGGILGQIGFWLWWNNWTGAQGKYFALELGDSSNLVYEESESVNLYVGTLSDLAKPDSGPLKSVESVHEPFSPCSVVEWIEAVSLDRTTESFPSLQKIYPDIESSFNTSEHVSMSVARDTKRVRSFTPRIDALTGYWKDISREGHLSKSTLVENLEKRGIDISMIETIPAPILTLLMNPIALCRPDPPTTWSEPLLRLVGRHDICVLLNQTQDSAAINQYRPEEQMAASGLDYKSISQRNTTEYSTGAIPEERSISQLAKLIYRADRRWNDIVDLLDPLRVAVAEIKQTSGTTEAQFLEEQKDFAQRVYKRTMATPSGQALLTYSRRRPLPTEKLSVESFNTSCLMQPSNNTVNADRSNFTEEKVCWAFFHAGVRTGLSQARDAKSIDTSWLVLNKPADLGNRHAGLLLGLGLNGHLKSMAKWLAFKYLTPKHNMTSIGLLLGLSASYLGSMNSLVTRLLTVHVTRLLPAGAAELNLSPLTQTAGIMGIGLLYYNSQHRRMSEVMLSEIENVDTEDASAQLSFRNEGYRLAAGFALGLINLGQGSDLHALHDMNVADRLLAVATGPREVQTVHILDQAAAGATIAIALLFMKSQDKNIARRIDVPQTLQQFDYSRPDILLLRVVAHNLIMWDEIEESLQWIHAKLPSEYRSSIDPAVILAISDALSSRWLSLYNILGGLCWSMSLRFAGSGSTRARECLFYFFDEVTSFLQLPYHTYDQMLTRDTLLRFQHLLALAFATVMAGTGDLDCMRRLRVLYATVRSDSTFGFHQAANMALGILFVGQGRYSFSTSNLAIASLLCAFYPLFPRDVLDNKAHLQAFRHMWTFATEARCLITRDVETNKPIITPVSVWLRDGTHKDFSAPGLLPDLSLISQVKTTSPEYWEVTLDFVKNPAHVRAFKTHQTLFLRRKSLLAQHMSPFSITMATRSVPKSTSQPSSNSIEWIFDLPAFKSMNIGQAEAMSIFSRGGGGGESDNQQASVTESSELRAKPASSSAHGSTEAHKMLTGAYAEADSQPPIATLLDSRTTGIDDTLTLARSVQSDNYSSLVGLRMLLNWADRQRDQEEEMGWVSSESMDSLKAMVFERARRELQSQQKPEQQKKPARSNADQDDDNMIID